MKNIKKNILNVGRILCMAAMFVAIHSSNVMCTGKYYQPKAPAKLKEFAENRKATK